MKMVLLGHSSPVKLELQMKAHRLELVSSTRKDELQSAKGHHCARELHLVTAAVEPTNEEGMSTVLSFTAKQS